MGPSDAALFKLLQPKEYFTRFLAAGVRFDGRTSSGLRETLVTPGAISNNIGSCVVRIGSTAAVAGIQAQVARPGRERPEEGDVVVNVSLAPVAGYHPWKRHGAKSAAGGPTLALEVRNVLMNTPGVLNLSSLVIEAGKAVWVLYVDIVLLDADGALPDALLIAAVGALNNLRLPDAEIDSVGAVRASPAVDDAKRLVGPDLIKSMPITTTFGLYAAAAASKDGAEGSDESNANAEESSPVVSIGLLADPTREEEDLVVGLWSITVCNGAIVASRGTVGPPGLTDTQIDAMAAIAISRASSVVPQLSKH